MADATISDAAAGESIQSRSVQSYIDETPIWKDGTTLHWTPLTPMQWRIWGLATAGKFFEGLVVFMTGVALPLIKDEFNLSAMQKGAVGAATLFGILVGATALGGLADKFGRKHMFIAELIIFTIFLIAILFSPSWIFLVVCLFGMGIALGCDYPTAHIIISENIPSSVRGRLVLGAFGFQAVGALVGTGIGYLILSEIGTLASWRWMYATAIIPALLVILGRFFIPQSAHFLVTRRQYQQAEHEMQRLLMRRPQYPQQIKLAPIEVEAVENPEHEENRGSWLALFRGRNRRATFLAAIPWFLQDLGTYGIGIFTPTILATVIGQKTEHAMNVTDIVYNDVLAAEGAALIDVLLIVGVIFAVFLADKVGRIKLQIFGFIGCALGLFLAALGGAGQDTTGGLVLIFAGFMVFSFMTNIGPNAMTYLIAGEVFPTHIRGKGAGFAASFAKIGAVLTAFCFPWLLATIGTQVLLYCLVGTSILGAVMTYLWRIETKGLNLEDLGKPAEMQVPPHKHHRPVQHHDHDQDVQPPLVQPTAG